MDPWDYELVIGFPGMSNLKIVTCLDKILVFMACHDVIPIREKPGDTHSLAMCRECGTHFRNYQGHRMEYKDLPANMIPLKMFNEDSLAAWVAQWMNVSPSILDVKLD